MNTAASVLSVRGLTKNFGALAVAQAIDLDLHPGARVGLIGPNGAGKTTLVNLLTGMVPRDIEGMKPEARVKRGLARTHQINTLLNEISVRDNVAIAVAERKGYAWRAMRYTPEWRACREEAERRLAEMSIAHVSSCPTANSACWRLPSRWRSPLACCCWTSPAPACRRRRRTSSTPLSTGSQPTSPF
jgi:branched-chain amino acid transport system ATP-binding protein